MGACGSSAAACKKDRSASTAQNECICATPWLKNSCAFGLDVVIGKSICPCPVIMWAGKAGAVPPGGGAHMSAGLVSVAANSVEVPSRAANKLWRMCLLQFLLDQITQLPRSERGTIHLGSQPARTVDHGGLRSVRDHSFFRQVVHAKSPCYSFDLRIRPGKKSPPIRPGIPNFSVSEQDLWRIILRIDGDGKQYQLLADSLAKPGLQASERGGEARTDIRQRTTRVHEIDRDDSAAEIGKPHRPTELIGQSEVRHDCAKGYPGGIKRQRNSIAL